ncbi:MAG: hypothetical protein SF028_07550 [Candidatus Sumerlaeia bacterium]|nr:hypothetical protein [Candidatus Sumerlaeia bacterium]
MKLTLHGAALAGGALDDAVEAFRGETALALVRAMQAARPFLLAMDTGAFIDSVVDGAHRFAGIALIVKGESDAERAASLVGALLDAKLATLAEDERDGATGDQADDASAPKAVRP